MSDTQYKAYLNSIIEFNKKDLTIIKLASAYKMQVDADDWANISKDVKYKDNILNYLIINYYLKTECNIPCIKPNLLQQDVVTNSQKRKIIENAIEFYNKLKLYPIINENLELSVYRGFNSDDELNYILQECTKTEPTCILWTQNKRFTINYFMSTSLSKEKASVFIGKNTKLCKFTYTNRNVPFCYIEINECTYKTPNIKQIVISTENECEILLNIGTIIQYIGESDNMHCFNIIDFDKSTTIFNNLKQKYCSRCTKRQKKTGGIIVNQFTYKNFFYKIRIDKKNNKKYIYCKKENKRIYI